MEHLSLEIFDLEGTGSKYATLPEDTVITITDTSEIFASGDVWSHSFTLNVRANAHIFGTTGELHGSRLHDMIHKRRARLWVEGLPMYLGYIILDDEAEVDEDGNVDVSFESGQKTFDEMIEGAKANQVPMMGDVRFGVALWRKRKVRYGLKMKAGITFEDGKTIEADVEQPAGGGITNKYVTVETDGDNADTPVQQYPRMVFPKGNFYNYLTGATEPVDCLNTDNPYAENEDGTPIYPFCNTVLCYQKYGYERKNENGDTYNDYNAEPEAEREYEEMPADRVNSAPNFFVIYWLRALMRHLGIHIEENQMMGVEDLRRLFFVNTKCAYDVPDEMRNVVVDERYGKYTCERGFLRNRFGYVPERVDAKPLVTKEESGLDCTRFEGEPTGHPSHFSPEKKTIKEVSIKITEVLDWEGTPGLPQSTDYLESNNIFHNAYATSDCFPDTDISEVIKAVESGFGVRFLFSSDYRRVRIVLLRNIFRSEEVQHIDCDIVSDVKVENNIRGFRMTYGQTEDTHFYYKGFADLLPHEKQLWTDNSDTHDYSRWSLSEDYGNLLHKVSAFNKTCYVTPVNGNAYGVKVDNGAKRYEDLHPSLFEYAGFMDAEDGDCTGEEETIEEVTVGFVPAVMNDLNMKSERDDGLREQRFALFVDEKMRPRRPDLNDGTDYNSSESQYNVNGGLYAKDDNGQYKYAGMMADGIVKPGEFAIQSDMVASASGLSAKFTRWDLLHMYYMDWNLSIDVSGHIYEGYRLYLQDNYEPNDDGVPPIEEHDWGLTLCVMRGSGSDAYVKYEYDPDDHEENDTWHVEPGSSVTSHPDTCDSYGGEWDYDGSLVETPAGAASKLRELFPSSDAPFNDSSMGYITETTWFYTNDADGNRRSVLVAVAYSRAGETVSYSGDIRYWSSLSLEEVLSISRSGRHMVIETDSSQERGDTVVQLCSLAYGGSTEQMIIDNGVGSRYGRFSLKLRAEKPNPYFDPTRVDSSLNRRYLPVSNENLRRRGLCDQFYLEYSYWVRNARIAKRTTNMGLAQLRGIDKTKKVQVGDVTGFVRKMQYSVSIKSGLGLVTSEIMYI